MLKKNVEQFFLAHVARIKHCKLENQYDNTKTNIGYFALGFHFKKGLIKTPANIARIILSQNICSLIKDFYTFFKVIITPSFQLCFSLSLAFAGNVKINRDCICKQITNKFLLTNQHVNCNASMQSDYIIISLNLWHRMDTCC